MADQLYEGMFLVDSGRFASDPEGVTQNLLGLLEKVGATVVAHRPWQDGKLAYPIEGHRKGLHYLTYFRMDPAGSTALDKACRLSDLVIRKLIIKHTETMFDAMVGAISAPESTESASSEPTPAESAPEKEAEAAS